MPQGYQIYKPRKNQKIKVSTLLDRPSERCLLDLWREVVFLRAGYRCEYPGCRRGNREYLNPHHIYSRIHGSTKFDPDNGMCLCSGHHTLNENSAHHDPEFKEIIIANGVRTREFYDKLRMRAFSPCKNDYNLIKIALEQEIKRLKIC